VVSKPVALQVDLDFEEPTELEFIRKSTRIKRSYFAIRHAYPDNPEKEHLFIQDAEPHPQTAVARIGDGIGVEGGRALELEFAADEMTKEHRKERMELYIARGGDTDSAMRLGDVRYLGYALYIDPEIIAPEDHATITQCWQHPISTESFRTGAYRKVKVVPMWMALREIDGQYGYTLHVKNEGKPKGGAYRAISRIAGRGTFRPGWNTLIYRFEPNHINQQNPGRITLWVNTFDEANPTHDRTYNWGVTPQDELPEGLPDTDFIDRFDVRMGMYRPKEESRLRLVYDNIRYGKTFDEVIPAGPDEFDWDAEPTESRKEQSPFRN
jgi:hypothetical protein